MTANYAIWWFIRPSHLLFFGLVLSLVLLLRGRTRGAKIALIVAMAGLFVGGVLPAGGWLLIPLENRFPEPTLPAHVDGIIVLAGGEEPAQSAQHGFAQLNDYSDRLLTALILARRYPDARLVHSGRTPVSEDDDGHETTASDVARTLLLSAGLEERRLTLEDRSTNTCESARELARLLGPNPDDVWLLVTSAFHMPRSVACFRAAGLEVLPVPVDYRQASGFGLLSGGLASNLRDLDLAAHEWLGLAYYRVRGVTDELFPAPRP